MSDMLKLKIVKVVGGPQGPDKEGQFDGPTGPIYKFAWLCEVDTGKGTEQARLTVGSSSTDDCPNGKYIAPGCTVCSKKRSVFKNVASYYIDGKATKEANGEGFGQHGGGGGNQGAAAGGGASQQASGGHGGGSSYGSPNIGQRVGMVINNATAIAIAEMQAEKDADGNSSETVDLARLDEIATVLFAIAVRLEGQQAPAGAGGQASQPGMNDAMKAELMKSIQDALNQANLEERWSNSSISEDQAIEVWTKCGANAMQFAIAISKMLADEPELPPAEGDGSSPLPF